MSYMNERTRLSHRFNLFSLKASIGISRRKSPVDLKCKSTLSLICWSLLLAVVPIKLDKDSSMLYYIIEAVFLAMFVEIFGAFWTNFILNNLKLQNNRYEPGTRSMPVLNYCPWFVIYWAPVLKWYIVPSSCQLLLVDEASSGIVLGFVLRLDF